MKIKYIILIILTGWCGSLYAQDLIADNMLMFQRANGGWPKHLNKKAINYRQEYSEQEKEIIRNEYAKDDATIDNSATIKEIRYLVKQFKQSNNRKYLAAAENGIRYLLKAQYKNGGWPQYYPDHSSYRGAITYNDNAMINVLSLLQDVVLKQQDLEVIDESLSAAAAQAVAAGIDCILKTQVRNSEGKLTAWCAQHDAVTLQPVKARAFELVSLSGFETVGIVDFLMKQPNPSVAIKNAINAAVEWLETVKIKGYKFVEVTNAAFPEGKDKVLLPDSSYILWARFYDIDTNEPFFCGRDGLKKKAVKDIDHERRNGYAWYGNWGSSLLDKKYPKWLMSN